MNAAEIKSEIARLHRVMNGWLVEGRLDADTEADILGEIRDIEDEITDLEGAAPDRT